MLYLDSLDDKPQVLYINSPGGEISPALGIYDTMASLKSQVGTLAFGHAWSIAAFLLAAGAKVSLFLDCARVCLFCTFSDCYFASATMWADGRFLPYVLLQAFR
jgi:ATP-dependent Clp endopeptidase proteolytic subunit ClpP